MAAGAPPPSCPICYEDVQNRPVLTRCVHMFCYDCMRKHSEARRVLNLSGVAEDIKCPFCRQTITPADLLEIDTSLVGSEDSGAGTAEESLEDAIVSVDMQVECTSMGDGPVYSKAMSSEDFEKLPMENGLAPCHDGR